MCTCGYDAVTYGCASHGIAPAALGPRRPEYGSHGPCMCEHVDHPDHPRSSGAWTHGHTYGAESRLIYWVRPIGGAVCGPCGLAIMAEFPAEVESLGRVEAP